MKFFDGGLLLETIEAAMEIASVPLDRIEAIIFTHQDIIHVRII
jgi:hypothetical protein